MGITGLLPFLKSIHKEVNISQFAGCTVAIDAYCWLHKGAFSCAEKLAVGEKTDQYVYYCMKYVQNLLKNNIKPILVFDGCHLKSKADVEKGRRERREMNRKKAAQFLREGRRSEAKECFQRCVDITPQMALNLMNTCRDQGIDCIVAPYEADAQLAFLNIKGIAQVVITEDSDLLLFGCEKVMFKMDFAGNGILIEKNRLNEVLHIQDSFYTFDKFRYMCILSGCDYLQSLHGIGLAKACKVFKLARQNDIRQVLKKLSTYLKTNINAPPEYVEGFVRADNTFLYQLVFDPLNRQLCPLNPYPPEIDENDLDYAGQYFPKQKAFQIALGNIDIYTHKTIWDFDPDEFKSKKSQQAQYRHQLSIWDKNYHIKTGSPCKEIQSSQTERLSLHTQERKIKVKHSKKSPVKRPRDSDVVSEAKRLKESLQPDTLLDMLDQEENCENRDKCDATKATEEDPEDFLSEASEDESPENVVDVKIQEKSPTVKLSAANIGDQAFGDVKTKWTPSSLRHNNMFAVPVDAAKPTRFNLNATIERVEVKSRYFASREGSPGTPVKLSPRKSSPCSPCKSSVSSPRKKTTLSKQKKTPEQPNIRSLFVEQMKNLPQKSESRENSNSFSLQKSDSINSKHSVGFSTNRLSVKKSVKSGASSAFVWSNFKFTPRQDTPPAKSCDISPKSEDKGFCDVKEENQRDSDELSKEEDTNENLVNVDNNRMSSNKSSALTPLSSYFSRLPKAKSPDCGRVSSVSNNKCTNSENTNMDDDVTHIETCDYTEFLSSLNGCKNESCDDNSERIADSSSQESESTQETYVTDSQRSSLGSIDSFCFPNTQDMIDLTDSETDSQVMEKSAVKITSLSLGKVPCRVSGLSRNKSKTKTKNSKQKNSLSSSGQPKINSLAKFAFSRNPTQVL